MSLTVQDGKLVVRNGALGTTQGCCCNKCSGPCPNGVSECAPGCGCSNSQCVPCSGPCGPPVCIYKWYDPEGDPIVACPPGFSIRFDPDTGEEWCDKSGGAVGCAECEANKPSDIPDVQVVCFEETPCPEGCVCVDGECVEQPADGCFERALLGDEAYVDGWCANAASSVGFAGSPCELTTATCGARTLVADYGGGFGDWIVTVCCDNPLP